MWLGCVVLLRAAQLSQPYKKIHPKMEKIRDILDKDDIRKLTKQFYLRINEDVFLSSFFVETDWERHQKIMVEFWSNLLFYSGDYRGNPVAKHMELIPLKSIPPHAFIIWIEVFCATVDSLYAGKNADLIKQRSSKIALYFKAIAEGNDSEVFNDM